MKFFAFIMAFIVLALSVMPCADQDNSPNDSEQKTLITKTAHTNSDQQAGDCSPFCQCSCCAGFALNHLQTVISQLPEFSDRPEASPISSDLFSIALPIWQPPQLV